MLADVGLVVGLPVVLGERGGSVVRIEHDAMSMGKKCAVASTGCVVKNGAHVVAINYYDLLSFATDAATFSVERSRRIREKGDRHGLQSTKSTKRAKQRRRLPRDALAVGFPVQSRLSTASSA